MSFRWDYSHLNINNNDINIEECYFDKDNKIYGCKHYKKKCFIKAECCNKFYVCRLCHNEKEDHEIDRFKIKTIMCMICKNVQNISNECEKCHVKFARYFCNVCHFYNDDENIQIYVFYIFI